MNCLFLGAAATLFEAILVIIHGGSFVLSVLDGFVGISGNLFHAHVGAGSQPSSAVGEPWKSGKKGRP